MPNPTINVSYCAPVNTPSSNPQITPSQLWEVLKFKAHHPEKFIKPIQTASVLSVPAPTPEYLKRVVIFRPQKIVGMPNCVIEDVKFLPTTRIEFRQSTGTVINNVISTGPPLTPDSSTPGLYLTSSYEWFVPDEIKPESSEYKQWTDLHTSMAKMSADMIIELAREMVGKGEINGA